MACKYPKSLQLPPLNLDGNFKDSEHNKAFSALLAASANIDVDQQDVDLTGAVIQFQRADGYASYVVKEDKGGRVLVIQHINFLDGYRIEDALIRGLRREDILQQLRFRIKFNRR